MWHAPLSFQRKRTWYVLFVIGIGLNVNMNISEIDEEIRQKASSLSMETKKVFERASLCGMLLLQPGKVLSPIPARRRRGDMQDLGGKSGNQREIHGNKPDGENHTKGFAKASTKMAVLFST